MIIGVSGKSGAGKSSIAKYLQEQHGFISIDTDKLVEKIRKENVNEILSIVQDNSILDNGVIDSKKLGAILFENKELLAEYNQFIYSKLKEVVNEEIYKYDDVVVDSMFLPIMDVFLQCEYKILVECDDEMRKKRIVRRDSISEEYFRKRDDNSLSYIRNDFDFIVVNNKFYKKQIDEIIRKIKR